MVEFLTDVDSAYDQQKGYINTINQCFKTNFPSVFKKKNNVKRTTEKFT